MPQLLRTLAVLALLLPAVPAATQERAPTPGEAAVNAVLSHRAQWLHDATPFNACRVYEALGRPADFPAGIRPAHRRLLSRTDNPCAPLAPGTQHGDMVFLDTLLVGDSTAKVSVTVRAGEQVHREQYRLVNLRRGSWGLDSVLAWGHLRVHAARPPEAAAGAPQPKPARDTADDCTFHRRAPGPARAGSP
ncbi:MAG TPA: hypothetical protein VNP72_10310 [Longimicrobium sp.]|nr:hypothetical protein [Longimicrobium sp.]